MAFAQRAFHTYYFSPTCQRYAEETGMEYVSVSGGTRYNPLRCTFNLYNDDGSFRARVDVPVSRMGRSPLVWLGSGVQWVLAGAFLLPAVWLARKLARHDD